jgi:hypothetical protein
VRYDRIHYRTLLRLSERRLLRLAQDARFGSAKPKIRPVSRKRPGSKIFLACPQQDT